MSDWVYRQALKHPGKMIWLGFTPAIGYVVYLTVHAMRATAWLGVFFIPMVLMMLALVYVIGKLADLNQRLDRAEGAVVDDDE